MNMRLVILTVVVAIAVSVVVATFWYVSNRLVELESDARALSSDVQGLKASFEKELAEVKRDVSKVGAVLSLIAQSDSQDRADQKPLDEFLPAPSGAPVSVTQTKQSIDDRIAKELANATKGAVAKVVDDKRKAAGSAKVAAKAARENAESAAFYKMAAETDAMHKCAASDAATRRAFLAKNAVDIAVAGRSAAENFAKDKQGAEKAAADKVVGEQAAAVDAARSEQETADAERGPTAEACKKAKEIARLASRDAASEAKRAEERRSDARTKDLERRAAEQIVKGMTRPSPNKPIATQQSPPISGKTCGDTCTARQAAMRQPPRQRQPKTTGTTQSDKRVLQLVIDGKSLLSKGLWGPAESAFREALRRQRNDIRALLGWADAAVGRDDSGEAVRRYSAAIEADRTCAVAYFGRGRLRIARAMRDAKTDDPAVRRSAQQECQLAVKDFSDAMRLKSADAQFVQAYSDAEAMLKYLNFLETQSKPHQPKTTD